MSNHRKVIYETKRNYFRQTVSGTNPRLQEPILNSNKYMFFLFGTDNLINLTPDFSL